MRELTGPPVSAGVKLVKEGDDVFDIVVNEALKGVIGIATKIETVADFSAAGGVPPFRGVAVGKTGEDGGVWRLGLQDRYDDLSSTGTKLAAGVRVGRVECENSPLHAEKSKGRWLTVVFFQALSMSSSATQGRE